LERLKDRRIERKPREIDANKSVLIVEDDRTNQLLLKSMLKKAKITNIDIANNGAEGVDMTTSTHYDLILMDCQMPIMDGLEATRQIRSSNNPCSESYIIAVTANVMSGDRERCLESGMNHYIKKPIKYPELKSILKHFVSKQQC
ncbi:MAG: response regulator, partial [Pseudomonadales bacterium]|nr:response regulator [Pseudomonadales bacterium]